MFSRDPEGGNSCCEEAVAELAFLISEVVSLENLNYPITATTSKCQIPEESKQHTSISPNSPDWLLQLKLQTSFIFAHTSLTIHSSNANCRHTDFRPNQWSTNGETKSQGFSMTLLFSSSSCTNILTSCFESREYFNFKQFSQAKFKHISATLQDCQMHQECSGS